MFYRIFTEYHETMSEIKPDVSATAAVDDDEYY